MKRRNWIILAFLVVAVIFCVGLEFLMPRRGWRFTGSLHHPRVQPAVTLLADGRVLVTGGLDASSSNTEKVLASCEIYDPATGLWTEIPPMNRPLYAHTATLLPDGRVLVCGGIDRKWDDLRTMMEIKEGTADCEIYDPVRNNWLPAARMSGSRFGQISFALPNGTIMAAGGLQPDTNQPGYQSTQTTEIYDPGANLWKAGPFMIEGDSFAAICPLSDQTIGLAGGLKCFNPGTAYISDYGVVSPNRRNLSNRR